LRYLSWRNSSRPKSYTRWLQTYLLLWLHQNMDQRLRKFLSLMQSQNQANYAQKPRKRWKFSWASIEFAVRIAKLQQFQLSSLQLKNTRVRFSWGYCKSKSSYSLRLLCWTSNSPKMYECGRLNRVCLVLNVGLPSLSRGIRRFR